MFLRTITASLIAFAGILFFGGVVFAQPEGTVYVPISGLDTSPTTVDTGDPDSYLQTLFTIFISVAVILAFIRLLICGIQYITSEAISSKAAARSCITSVVLGLLLVLLSYIVLETINENFTGTGFGELRSTIVDSVPEGEAEGQLGQEAFGTLADNNGDGFISGIDVLADTSGDGWCFVGDEGFTGFAKVICGSPAWDNVDCTAASTAYEASSITFGIDVECTDTARAFGVADQAIGSGRFCYDWIWKGVLEEEENPIGIQVCKSSALSCHQYKEMERQNNLREVTPCYKPYQ